MIKKILIFKKEFIFQLLFVQKHKYVRVKPFFSSWSGPLVNQLYCTVVVVIIYHATTMDTSREFHKRFLWHYYF